MNKKQTYKATNGLSCSEPIPVDLWKTKKLGFPQGPQEQLLQQNSLIANIQGAKIAKKPLKNILTGLTGSTG